MTTTDQDRRELYNRLRPTLGESADTLMELLPLHPTSDLATREDVLANATLLRGEMSELRAELRGEMSELRGEMTELRAEVRMELVGIRGEMEKLEMRLSSLVQVELANNRSEMTLLVSGLRDELISRRTNMAWTILGTIVAVVATTLAYIQVFGL